MLLAKLTFTTPGGIEIPVITGADTKQKYLDMGYTLVEEYEDGWLPEDMAAEAARAQAEGETLPELPEAVDEAVEEVFIDFPADGPAAVDDEAGSDADDQEGN